MTREQLAFEALLSQMDRLLEALLAPVGRRVSMAVRRAAGRTGYVPAAKVPYIHAVTNSAIEQVFGVSPFVQFTNSGVPVTPIAKAVSVGIREATDIGIGDVFSNLGQNIKRSPEIKTAIERGRFGEGKLPRIDTARTWVDPAGYRLSDRLWRTGQDVRSQIDAILEEGVRQGKPSVMIAQDLEKFLTVQGREKQVWHKNPGGGFRNEYVPRTTKTPYGKKGLYAPRRLARTEMTRALGVAQQEGAKLNPFVAGVKWSLSASHPVQDICDGYASQNPDGLGKGVYKKGTALNYPPHPQCLCYLSPVEVKDAEQVVKDLGRWARGEIVPGLENYTGIPDKEQLNEYFTGIKVTPKPVSKPAIPKVVVPKVPPKPPHLLESAVGSHKTTKEAEEWGREHYPHIQFGWKGAHIDAVNPTMKQFHLLAKEWPETADRLNYVGTYADLSKYDSRKLKFGSAFAHATRDGRQLGFNPAHYKDAVKLTKDLRYNRYAGWFASDGIESLMTHEFGHMVDNWLRTTTLSMRPLIGDISVNGQLEFGVGRVSHLWNNWRANTIADDTLSRYGAKFTQYKNVENPSEGLSKIMHRPYSEWDWYTKELDEMLRFIRASKLLKAAEYKGMGNLTAAQITKEKAALEKWYKDIIRKFKYLK